jgi:UDP-N-acetylmuramyl tripeptide synthase
MLRRGLGLGAGEADVVLLNNVAEDHLGEWGIQDLDMLADTKFVIRHAGKRVVLNADDQKSVERAHLVNQPITWFSLDAQNPTLQAHLATQGSAALLDGSALWWCEAGECKRLIAVNDVPITIDGAARHNIANALAAIAVAKELGLSEESILDGLRGFRSDVEDNPGRLNIFDLNGVKVLVDFAHNPHGLDALMTMAKAMKPKRLLVTVGHAGDRNDDAIREVALTAWRKGVDRIVIKEQEKDLRGRELGEIPQIMKQALLDAGAPEDAVDIAADEVEAAKQAIAWAQPGDLLLLLTLAQRDEVLRLIAELSS